MKRTTRTRTTPGGRATPTTTTSRKPQASGELIFGPSRLIQLVREEVFGVHREEDLLMASCGEPARKRRRWSTARCQAAVRSGLVQIRVSLHRSASSASATRVLRVSISTNSCNGWMGVTPDAGNGPSSVSRLGGVVEASGARWLTLHLVHDSLEKRDAIAHPTNVGRTGGLSGDKAHSARSCVVEHHNAHPDRHDARVPGRVERKEE